MNSVSPLILTLCTDNYKSFICQPFNFNMLYGVDKSQLINVIFQYWRGKNMHNYYKFTNDDDVILEAYSTYYTIQGKNIDGLIKLPIPPTINDFITDMVRYNVHLFWNDWIEMNLEPKDYLRVEDIPTYYTNLLKKMNKSHELILE